MASMTRAGVDSSHAFDEWARDGRAEKMERGHAGTAVPFLQDELPSSPFSFLDVGCGNGWAVRLAASREQCLTACGIDSSPEMVRRARARASPKEHYEVASMDSWRTRRRFDFAFAMESLYYVSSPSAAVSAVFGLLRPGGTFACGTDFYAENKDTRRWAQTTGLPMHLLSRRQWRVLFEDAGFSASTRSVRDPSSPERWKRENGTLFIVGSK